MAPGVKMKPNVQRVKNAMTIASTAEKTNVYIIIPVMIAGSVTHIACVVRGVIAILNVVMNVTASLPDRICAVVISAIAVATAKFALSAEDATTPIALIILAFVARIRLISDVPVESVMDAVRAVTPIAVRHVVAAQKMVVKNQNGMISAANVPVTVFAVIPEHRIVKDKDVKTATNARCAKNVYAVKKLIAKA